MIMKGAEWGEWANIEGQGNEVIVRAIHAE